MDAHYRGQLNGLQYLFHAGAGLERILYVARHAAKCEIGFEKIRIKFPELLPQRVPVTFRLMFLGMRISFALVSHVCSTSPVLE